jgi:hypothetical protein
MKIPKIFLGGIVLSISISNISYASITELETEHIIPDIGTYEEYYEFESSEFTSEGNMIVENFIQPFAISGTWILQNGRWWYQHIDGSYTRGGWEVINGKWYYFDASGWMVTGWINSGGLWYYLNSDGSMSTGWLRLPQGWYYLNRDGSMVNGWKVIDQAWYYFNGDGLMCTGWLEYGGHYYYLKSNGAMATGLTLINDNNAYFQSDGIWLYTVSLTRYHLVDSGKHLDWGGTSKYTAEMERGANTWNAYKPGVIRKDTIYTTRDVVISDFSSSSSNVYASTYPSGKILFNSYHMDSVGGSKQQQVATHEIGHALGLGHNSNSDVMGHGMVTKLSLSDKRSYDQASRVY